MRESNTEQRRRLTTATIGGTPDLKAYANKERRDDKQRRHLAFASARRSRLGERQRPFKDSLCKRLHCAKSRNVTMAIVTPSARASG